MKWWGVGLLLLIAIPISVKAAIQFNISNAEIADTEINLMASVSGLTSSSCPDGKCYLQGTLRLPQKNYFGQTQNNVGSWIDYLSAPEPDYIQSTFYSFQPESGSWSGQLKMHFSAEDTNYIGPGNYELKLRRFSGQSKSAAGESNTIVLSLNEALPSPTLTPTPTPTLTPKLSPTPKSSPPPSPKASEGHSTSTLVIGATPAVLAQVAPSQSQDAGAAGQIVQAQVSPVALASPSPVVLGAASYKSNWWAMGVMVIGGGVFGLAVYLLIRRAGTMEK